MSEPQPKTFSRRIVSRFSLIGKIFLMVVYRTVLLAAVFFVGHLANIVHWSLAILVAVLSFAFIVKFWSPSHVLDGSEINFGKD